MGLPLDAIVFGEICMGNNCCYIISIPGRVRVRAALFFGHLVPRIMCKAFGVECEKVGVLIHVALPSHYMPWLTSSHMVLNLIFIPCFGHHSASLT